MRQDATTSYGSWQNHGDKWNLTVAATIETAFGDFGSDGYDVEAIESDYRDAVNAALPAGVSLCGEDFYGPACSRNGCEGCEACGRGRPSLSDIIESIDLWAIIESHATERN